MLESERELEALCDDAGGHPRASIHAKISELIIGYMHGDA